jgi:ketosteroid isomerase-like protein
MRIRFAPSLLSFSSPQVAACFGVILLLVSCSAACPAIGTKHGLKSTKRQIEDMETEWRDAQLTGNVAEMDKLLSDDYFGISMTGQVNTKSQQLDRIRTRKLALTRIDLSDVKVKLIGSTAIVTSRAEVEGVNDGSPMKGSFRYTRVYQRTPAGQWKITNFEATRLSASDRAESEGRPSP